MKFFWLVVALLVFPGCLQKEVIIHKVDTLLFEEIGSTIFINPLQPTMKEVHLDLAALRGKEVILEGKISDVSEHLTYMVMSDDNARMLVVLNKLEGRRIDLRSNQTLQVRVLGTIENGQKGLPYIMARSLNISPTAGKA